LKHLWNLDCGNLAHELADVGVLSITVNIGEIGRHHVVKHSNTEVTWHEAGRNVKVIHIAARYGLAKAERIVLTNQLNITNGSKVALGVFDADFINFRNCIKLYRV
jgi:hypothetical protein